MRRDWSLRELHKGIFQCGSRHPPVEPPPDPEKKQPPIGPPTRDPKPEPIKDPPVPPMPGKDPKEDPKPIGDPPDQSDQPIRMEGVNPRIMLNTFCRSVRGGPQSQGKIVDHDPR